MWHKVRELQLKGLNKTQIGIYLGVNRKTVRRYLNMTMEEFSPQVQAETGKLRAICTCKPGRIPVYIGRQDT